MERALDEPPVWDATSRLNQIRDEAQKLLHAMESADPVWKFSLSVTARGTVLKATVNRKRTKVT